MAALADETYLSLTTYKKAGTPVPTAIWVVRMDNGDLGFWTAGNSGKVKRVRHTPKVTMQKCNRSGKTTPGDPVVEGVARLATDAERAEILRRINAKYKLMAKAIQLFGKIGDRFKPAHKRTTDAGLIVTLVS
jgi:uncharacterized protein